MNPQNLTFLAYGQLDGGRLRQHQAEGIAIMMATLKTLCADPVGAGKTVQAAGLIAYLAERGEVTLDRPALVLTMGSHLARQTAIELIRFLPDLAVVGLAGDSGLASVRDKRRRESLNQQAHVKVMTYSQWRTRHHLWEGPAPSVLILDEVSALKGAGADYAAVLRVASPAQRVHMFSATPYENDPLEMWTIYSLLNFGHLPERKEFERDYVAWKGVGDRRRPTGWDCDLAAEFFRQLTEPYYFRRDWAIEDLDRPRCTTWDWWTPLSPEQSRLMAVADRLVGLQRYQRQKEIVTGKLAGPSARAAETVGLIGQLVARDPDGKVLVITESLIELDAISAGLSARRIGWAEVRGETKQHDRADVVEAFRDDANCQVLLGSRVLERGLNLQFCRYLITVGLPDNPARVAQQIGRIVRHGSPYEEVIHYVVIADCAHDREAAKRVLRKQEHAAMVITGTG